MLLKNHDLYSLCMIQRIISVKYIEIVNWKDEYYNMKLKNKVAIVTRTTLIINDEYR